MKQVAHLQYRFEPFPLLVKSHQLVGVVAREVGELRIRHAALVLRAV